MEEELYQVKLKHNLYNIVLGEKITVPRGEIILNNITESELRFITYPLVVRDHGNGIKTIAEETDCVIEPLITDKDFIPKNLEVRLKEYGFDEPDTDYILYQQAFRWFRENKKLFGFVEQLTQHSYKFFVKDYSENKGLVFSSYVYNSYEEAELECLNKLFEI
jgi:hypothetical protein